MNNESHNEKKKNEEVKKKGVADKVAIIVSALVVLVISFAIQQPEVQDFWKGIGYEPSEKMSLIQESLGLTGSGERIFKAVKPALEDRDNFNSHCETHDADVSLLGCYTGGQIYVYEIQNEELKLANNVTTAHELLHATWQRMNEKEQAKITEWLEEIKANKAEWLEEELASYPEEEKLEEIYTRAGTKLRDLPADLEKHYAKYFKDRQKIVDYYEQYQAPFEKLKSELDELEKQIAAENETIKAKRAEYEKQADDLSAQIDRFNRCAESAGCFGSDAEFARQRNGLLADQKALEELRTATNSKIDENNAKIEQYNKLQESLGELNNAMNSHTEKI